jgi:hypothetical protein
MIERLLTGRVQLALVGETQVDARVELTPFVSDEILGIAKPGSLPGAYLGAGLQRSDQTSRPRGTRHRVPL